RVPVETVMNFISMGDSVDDILKGWPYLKREAVVEAIKLAAEALVERSGAKKFFHDDPARLGRSPEHPPAPSSAPEVDHGRLPAVDSRSAARPVPLSRIPLPSRPNRQTGSCQHDDHCLLGVSGPRSQAHGLAKETAQTLTGRARSMSFRSGNRHVRLFAGDE